MTETEQAATPLDMPAKLALAQKAFQDFHAKCFWFMRADATLSEADIPYICERLRADGGRKGFMLAATLCR